MTDMPYDQRLAFAPELSVVLDSDEDIQLVGVLVRQPVMLMFKNQSEVSVFVSDSSDLYVIGGDDNKGTTMVAGEEIIFDCRGNHGQASNMGFPVGTCFFVKALEVASTGSMKISYIYAK